GRAKTPEPGTDRTRVAAITPVPPRGRVPAVKQAGRRRSKPSPESLRHPDRVGEATLESRARRRRGGGTSSPTVQAGSSGEALRSDDRGGGRACGRTPPG